MAAATVGFRRCALAACQFFEAASATGFGLWRWALLHNASVEALWIAEA